MLINFFLCLLLVSGALNAQTLHITDRHSPDKNEVVAHLLELQSSWQVNIREMQSLNTSERGFLFVRMQPESVLHLLDDKNVKILWAEDEGEFLGYLIW